MATIEPLLRTDLKAVDKRDEVHTVFGWLTGDAKKVPIIVDEGKPFGILNERALMSRHLDQNAKVASFTLATRALPLTATLEEAAARMREFRAACLPVEDARGKLAGFVTSTDVARAQAGAGAQSRGRGQGHAGGPRASQLCSPVRSLEERQTLGDALHVFSQEYVDFLPVTNGGGKVTGVLPRRALLRMELDSNAGKGRKDAGGEKFHYLHDAVSGFMDDAPAMIPAAAPFDAVLLAIERSGYALVEKENGGGILGVATPETLLQGR